MGGGEIRTAAWTVAVENVGPNYLRRRRHCISTAFFYCHDATATPPHGTMFRED